MCVFVLYNQLINYNPIWVMRIIQPYMSLCNKYSFSNMKPDLLLSDDLLEINHSKI